MAAKKNQGNPPLASDGGNFMDQMRPKPPSSMSQKPQPEGFTKATAFETPQSVLTIPAAAPGQLEKPVQNEPIK